MCLLRHRLGIDALETHRPPKTVKLPEHYRRVNCHTLTTYSHSLTDMAALSAQHRLSIPSSALRCPATLDFPLAIEEASNILHL